MPVIPLKNMSKVVILGIETSCDETAAAVVVNGHNVISNVISSQIDVHREYGGVVPEIAARKHIDSISYIVKEALRQANMSLSDIDGVAVSNGPGLVGALLVGLSYAKALAFAQQIPLLGINHVYSHICANFIENAEPPFVCLVVSGGHTHLVEVKDHHNYSFLGRTRDDAAGEAFDKVGRVLGLPYPGGPEIDKLAKAGDPKAINFPRTTFENSLDFSFSGLKSAVLQHIQKNTPVIPDIAASFQQAAVEVLVARTIEACLQKGLSKAALAGGVAANKGLREAMRTECAKRNIDLFMPSIEYCTDNAAMVASGGYYDYITGRSDKYDLNAYPSLNI